MISRDCSG